jgi:hypothetical protein
MANEQDNDFSWTMLFLVTGFSLFLFAAVLAFLNDPFAEYFVYAGTGSVVAGIVAWILSPRMSPVQSRPVQRRQMRRRS